MNETQGRCPNESRGILDRLLDGRNILAWLALLVTINPALATPQPTAFTGLGTFGAFRARRAHAINEFAEVVGVGVSAAGDFHGFLWKDGVAYDIGDPGGMGFTVAFDINDSGVIVGDSQGSNGRRATQWSGFPPVFDADLGVSGGIESLALGINNAGEICGRNDLGLGPWLHVPGSGVVGLPSLPGNQGNLGFAYKINDAGYISGLTRNPGNPHQNFAVLWDPQGSVLDLGLPPGTDEANGRDVNASLVVAGESYIGDNLQSGIARATLWTPVAGGGYSAALLPSHPVLSGASFAWGLNDAGNAVGSIKDGTGTNHAVLWSNGVATDLNDLIDPSSGWFLSEALDLNEAGFIVGQGINPAGQIEAFLIGVAGTGGPADSDPPVVDITAPLDGVVLSSASVPVSADVTDASGTTVTSSPAGVSATLAAGGGMASGTVTLLTEGANTISVNAVDDASNTGGDSVTVTLDTIDPALDIVSPAGGTVFGASPIDVTVDVIDATATTGDVNGDAFSLAAGGGQHLASVALSEGSNLITASAADEAGNTESASVSVILDLTAPIVTVDSPLNGALFGPGSEIIGVTATVDDLTATTTSSVPTGVSDVLPAGGGITSGVVSLTEGSNLITVTATDAAGRAGSDSISVVLDTTPPSVTFDSPQAGDPVRGVVDFHVQVSDALPGSGIGSVDLLVDGSLHAVYAAGPYEASLDTTALADGSHTLSATATDGTGNDTTAGIGVLVDNTPPALSMLDPLDGAVLGGTIPFDVSASDGGSGLVAITMSAGGVAPTGDASITYGTPASADTRFGSENTARWPDGPLTLSATSVDAAGNESLQSVTVTVDNTAPQKSLLAPTDGDVVTGTLAIQADAQDSNLSSIEIKVDGVSQGTSATSPFTVNFDTSQRLDGTMSVDVIVTDAAGNASSCSASVTVNNIAYRATPATLNLKSKGNGPVFAHLEGVSVGLLIPTENQTLELRVPGGSPVLATVGFSGDDATTDADGDGLPELQIRFDRKDLIASIKAGIAAGMIQANTTVDVTLTAGGGTFELGTHNVRIKGS
jgi:probable HAF family extracellular repeat protein